MFLFLFKASLIFFIVSFNLPTSVHTRKQPMLIKWNASQIFLVKSYSFKTGMHNIRPAGQMCSWQTYNLACTAQILNCFIVTTWCNDHQRTVTTIHYWVLFKTNFFTCDILKYAKRRLAVKWYWMRPSCD